MRKMTVPAMMAATLLLGGCAGYGGLFGNDGYGYDDGYGYSGYRDDFERAAVKACGREASRYGRVSINSVDQRNRDTVIVTGSTSSRDRRRNRFGCTFRSDGRIVDFQRF